MNILVTGASGFVGPHLVAELANYGHRVWTTGMGSEKRFDRYMGADLTKPQAVGDLVRWSKPDAIIHLAGLAAVGPSFDRPLDYITINMGAQINLFEACLRKGVTPRMLIISSGTLYDPHSPLPLTERSAVKPSSPYAISKLGQEQLANYYTLRGFKCLIARPFNHIGPGQGRGFFVSDLASQIVAAERNGGGSISVGNLDAKRDYTDVRDISAAYRLLIEPSVPPDIYNVCNGQSWSCKEILDILIAQSSVALTVTNDETRLRPSDTPELRGDCSRLTRTTEWKPSFELNESLKDVLNDWRERAAEG